MNTKRNTLRHPTLALPLLICLIGAATAGISIATLYRVSIDEEKTRLTQMVHSQARLMEAVAEFENAHSHQEHPGGAFGATMAQIVAAHKSIDGFGETGEYVIGKLIDGQVALLQPPRFEGDLNFQIPAFAPVPMQRALSGESGVIIAPDYKGNEVLASYVPVPVLNIGLVAKIDTHELYRPFIVAGLVATLLSALMLVIGFYAARYFAAPFAEREAVLKTLTKNQKELAKAQQLAGLGSWSWNLSDNFEEWSDEQFRIFGYEPGEVTPTLDLFINALHPKDQAEVALEVENTLNNDAPYDTEFRIIDAKGKVRHVQAHGEVARDKDGKAVSMIGTIMDITERRTSEQALKKSEERFTKSQNFANIGTWDWDIQNGNLYWSDRIAPFFGYKAGTLETTYENFVGAIHPDDRQAVTDAVTACVEDGIKYNIEHRVVWPDGTVRYLHEKGDVVRDEDGKPLNMLGVVQDITKSKSLQAQLIQSSKMATLGEMATGVAHELHQPLNVIRMAINNIQRKLKDNKADPGYLSNKLGKINNQVERATAIIEHMCIFGRKPGTTPVPLDPKKIVDSTLGMIGEQLRLADIQVTVEAPEKCLPILGHQVQVEQVLLNLIGNARDILKDWHQGEKRISITVGESADAVIIAVEDSGGGITESDLPRIFEPFFTTKEIGQGTGLGLSISYGIITDMGGTITAANTDGGARFVICLPQSKQETVAA